MPELNPLSDDFRNNREAVFKRLRDIAPVVFTDDGLGLILRYADVRAAALDPETFSSGGPTSNPARPVMNSMDPPEHGMYRAMMNSAFDMKYQAGLEASFRHLARSLITKATAGNECDLMKDVVKPYLYGAASIILGLNDDQVKVLQYSMDRIQRIGTEPVETPNAQERCDAMFTEVIQERRANPGNDHLSALLAVGSDGGRSLTQIELLEYLLRFNTGNSVTNTAAIGNGIELLARHPEQRAELVANPSLIPNAFEEMVRREGPTQDTERITTREVTISGITLPANTRVDLVWGAANLDEREFADPEKFDIYRDTSGIMAWGVGEHSCYAAYLARLEARVFFEEFLSLIPNFTLSGPPVRVRSAWSWAFESIPVSIP